MRASFIRVFAGFLALSLAALIGCGSDTGAESTSLTITMSGWDPNLGFVGPLEGVEVCEIETDNCVVTSAAGVATFEVAVAQEVSFTLEKEGYQSYIMTGVATTEPGELTLGMSTVQRIEDMHTFVMSPYPMEGTGDIVVISEPKLEGETLSLTGGTGKVFYYNALGNWDASLTATSSWGWGGFTEVSPGEVQVELGGTATGCTVTLGWPGDVANSVRMPIRAGYLTQVYVSCEAP